MDKLRTTHLAFVGDFVPRRCGIATFTADICEAIATEFPKTKCIVGSVNDRPEGYDYPGAVRFEIAEQELDSYRRAAEFLNINNVEVLSVQHEFGIYGGPAGSHLLALLRDVRMPIVTTLHTVLQEPNSDQRAVMSELSALSSRFIVMAERGRSLLERVYGVPAEKIDLIPHGVIDMPFMDSNFYKDEFGVEGKTVLLTFGLLSPNKGIENVIEAMPAILSRHPEVVYIVLGATHPNLLASEGEKYRHRLEALVEKLGVGKQVIFHNRYVSLEELKEFIGAADIYLTPYLNEAQITSGTLAYTFGAGKAIISTPYWHAQELLAGERGILVPFASSGAIAEAVNEILSQPTRMTAMRKRAWKQGREMIWPVVARRYMESFARARTSMSEAALLSETSPRLAPSYPLPELKLDHLFTMSDHTGIFQHAIYNVPNFHEGYCTDDNARAFIFTVLLEESGFASPEVKRLASSYLAFLWYAFDGNRCRFRNFMSYSRQWLEVHGSEDSHARALWAVATALGRSKNVGHRRLCALLFQRGLPPVARFSSPRAWAFALIAIHEYLRTLSGDRVVAQMRDTLTAMLVDLYRANSAPDWLWFERSATYDNAKLSHAMILSGYWTSQGETLQIGLKSLRWLLDAQTTADGHFAPIGCHGFWPRGGELARFDQQPLEAHAMVSACVEAFAVTRDPFWRDAARRCFEWFLGRNDLGLPLHDVTTGGCRDALLQDHLNQNQGAESSLAFYLSLVELRRAEEIHGVFPHLMSPLEVEPTGVVFRPENKRVLVRPFISSDEERVRHIIERALSLSEAEVETQLAILRADFNSRHVDLEACWRRHFAMVRGYLGDRVHSFNRHLYIGALFSGEYALESAALFNPSIVAHPDQEGLEAGAVRFVLSLRATGEGHISSIEFRSGILHADSSIEIDPVSPLVIAPDVLENPTYRKEVFVHKLNEMGFENDWARQVLAPLGAHFTHDDLKKTIREAVGDENNRELERTKECIQWLAQSNYEVHFHPSVTLSQRIIFPVSPNETNGIEDARFVRFCEEDGTLCYYATYTAYNGRAILPQLIETPDFQNFRVVTLNGHAVQNKGMALFPRRIDGHYAMISRQDDENLFLMYSDNLHFWNDPRLLSTPRQPWEFVKIGNCGSPIETPEGWLVITHGVGPMRRYCMGALLLDLEDPSKVIGSLTEPLLKPRDEEREGYVPNVVYSCGAMVHRDRLILPYALSDTSSTIGRVDLAQLLETLRRS